MHNKSVAESLWRLWPYVNLEQHEESSCYFDSQIDDDKLADGELVEHRLGDTI